MRTIVEVDSQIIAPKKDLFTMPVVITVTDFNQRASASFAEKISAAHNNSQPVIPVLIDSPGGRVHDLLYMLSIIERSEKPVATVALGKAHSCGCFLLSAGTPGYRYADQNSSIMLHDIAGGAIGKGADIEVSAAEISRLKKLCFKKMDKNCQQERGYCMNLLSSNNNTNLYLTPTMAKKHKIVDHIGVPSLKISVDVTTEFIGS